jgi:transposase
MVKELFTAAQKQLILTALTTRRPAPSFRSLAVEFNIREGHTAISRWYKAWNGTIQSLQRKRVSGRPRILNKNEMTRLIKQPILRKNRVHRPIHYSELVPAIREKMNKKISSRTVRRYGKEEIGIKQKRTIKRTSDECEYTIQTGTRTILLFFHQ